MKLLLPSIFEQANGDQNQFWGYSNRDMSHLRRRILEYWQQSSDLWRRERRIHDLPLTLVYFTLRKTLLSGGEPW